MSALEKKELQEILRIAYIHAGRIKMAMDELKPLLPFDAQKIELAKAVRNLKYNN